MEAYDDALRKALEAGDFFDINEGSEYTETVVSKCLDDYIAACVAADETGEEKDIGANLISVVERMFEKCVAQGYVQQVRQLVPATQSFGNPFIHFILIQRVKDLET